MPLGDLIEAAEQSRDPRRSAVLYIAGFACQAGEYSHMLTKELQEDWVQELQEHRMMNHAAARAHANEMMSAVTQLAQWCTGHRAADLLEASERMYASDGGVGKGPERLAAADTWQRQKQEGDIEQILLNPQMHPEAFQLWLWRLLPQQVPAVWAMLPFQRHYVRDLLYFEFTGAAPDPQSLRSLISCIAFMWCSSSHEHAPPGWRERAEEVAEQVAFMIRTQRMAERLRWPG